MSTLWEKHKEDFINNILPKVQAYKSNHPLETLNWEISDIIQCITTYNSRIHVNNDRIIVTCIGISVNFTISKRNFFFKINKGDLNKCWDAIVKEIELLLEIGLLDKFEKFKKYYRYMFKSDKLLKIYNESGSWRFNISVDLSKWEKLNVQTDRISNMCTINW